MAGWEVVETSEDGIKLIRPVGQAMCQQVTKTIAGYTAASGKATFAAKNNNKAARVAAKDNAARVAANNNAARGAGKDKAARLDQPTDGKFSVSSTLSLKSQDKKYEGGP